MGMTYYQSYTCYELHVQGKLVQQQQPRKSTNRLINSERVAMNGYNPPRFVQFPSQQQALIEEDNPDPSQVQSMQKFDILDEFEINI